MSEKKGKLRSKKSSQTEGEGASAVKEEIVRADLWILKSERGLIKNIQKQYFKEDGPLHICEVLRAGIYALGKLPTEQVQEIVDSLVRLKQR